MHPCTRPHAPPTFGREHETREQNRLPVAVANLRRASSECEEQLEEKTLSQLTVNLPPRFFISFSMYMWAVIMHSGSSWALVKLPK